MRQKYFLSWQQKASLASRHLHNSPFRVSLFGLAESKMWARRRGGRAAVEGRGCYLCCSLLLSFLTLNLIARCRAGQTVVTFSVSIKLRLVSLLNKAETFEMSQMLAIFGRR